MKCAYLVTFNRINCSTHVVYYLVSLRQISLPHGPKAFRTLVPQNQQHPVQPQSCSFTSAILSWSQDSYFVRSLSTWSFCFLCDAQSGDLVKRRGTQWWIVIWFRWNWFTRAGTHKHRHTHTHTHTPSRITWIYYTSLLCPLSATLCKAFHSLCWNCLCYMSHCALPQVLRYLFLGWDWLGEGWRGRGIVGNIFSESSTHSLDGTGLAIQLGWVVLKTVSLHANHSFKKLFWMGVMWHVDTL